MIRETVVKSKREGYNIPCIYNFTPNMSKIIIAIHGFGSSKESSTISLLINTLNECNIGVIALDLPCHGKSMLDSSNLTVKNCIDDINSVEEYVRKMYPKCDIGLFASSFGAYLTLLKITKSDVKYKSVVLRCPAICMSNIVENMLLLDGITLDKLKEIGATKEKYANKFEITYSMYEDLKNNDIFKVYNSDNNILLIQGTDDRVAPIEDTIRLVNKFSNVMELVKIEGAGHTFEGTMDRVMDITKEYMLNT